MGTVPLHQLGSLGIVKDTPFHEQPLRAWTGGRNVRFTDGAVESFLGESQVRALAQSPRAGQYVNQNSVQGIVNLSLTKAHIETAGAETDITRAAGDYTASESTPWTCSFLTGIPIFNNYADIPQYWAPVSTAQRLQNLTNWPSTLRAKVVRAYKNFLVALYVSKSSVEYPHMVKWSDAADPGAVPSSWDESLATKLAGEQDLADTKGVMVDCCPLGDVNLIYKQDCVWTMSFVGGTYVFAFRKLFTDFGIYGVNCVVEVDRKHFVLTADDFIVHNGATFKSVLSERWKKYLFSSIEPTQQNHVFVYHHKPKREIWVCYPTAGQTWATEAMVYNYEQNTIGVRELPGVAYLVQADLGAGSDWDSDSQSWDADLEVWNAAAQNTSSEVPHAGQAKTSSLLLKLENTNQFNGVTKTSNVERVGWAIDGGKTAEGEPRCDLSTVKLVTRLWPKFECSDPTKVKFYVGAQTTINGAVTWFGPFTCDEATQFKIDCVINARLLAFRVESTDDVYWKLWGVDIEIGRKSKF